ncbi:hypothetical protein [Ramlibacter paludis]
MSRTLRRMKRERRWRRPRPVNHP